jgi:hypothetical protein
VALTSVGAIATHNFHLDRFLLGVAAPLWALAALGVARRLPARASAAGGVLAVGLTLALVFPTVDSRWLVDGLGVRTSDNADYVDGLQRERLDLTPGRDLPTAGLVRSEHDALLAVPWVPRLGSPGSASTPSCLRLRCTSDCSSEGGVLSDSAVTRARSGPTGSPRWS